MDQYQFFHTGSYVKIIIHNIPDRPGVFAKMSKILANRDIKILTIRHSARTPEKGEIAFTISKEQVNDSIQLRKENLQELGASDLSFKKTWL